MAVDFGKLVVGGKEHHHPLTSEEIRFILEIFKKCNFTGEEMENLLVVISFVPVKGLDANTSGFCGANESTFGDEYLYNKYVLNPVPPI